MKISSKNAEFRMEDANPARVDLAPTDFTAAKPAVMTLASTTGIEAGDVILIQGTGWHKLDGRAFRAANITATTVELEGSDTTGETAEIADEAAAYEATLLESCLTTFSRQAATPAQIDATTLCSTSRERVPGLPDQGTFSIAGFYDMTDPGYLRLIAAAADGRERVMGLFPSDGSALLFRGYISGLGESVAVDQMVSFTGSGFVSGDVTYIPPAAP